MTCTVQVLQRLCSNKPGTTNADHHVVCMFFLILPARHLAAWFDVGLDCLDDMRQHTGGQATKRGIRAKVPAGV